MCLRVCIFKGLENIECRSLVFWENTILLTSSIIVSCLKIPYMDSAQFKKKIMALGLPYLNFSQCEEKVASFFMSDIAALIELGAALSALFIIHCTTAL